MLLVFIFKPTIETAEQVPVAHNGGGAHSPRPEGLVCCRPPKPGSTHRQPTIYCVAFKENLIESVKPEI